MFSFRNQPKRSLFAGATPAAKSLGLMVIDDRRPIPGHRNYFKTGTQPILMRPGRTVRYPKRRQLYVAKRAPAPTFFRPIFFLVIAAVADKLPIFTVAGEAASRGKSGDGGLTTAVFIVPTKTGIILRFADIDLGGGDVDQAIMGINLRRPLAEDLPGHSPSV